MQIQHAEELINDGVSVIVLDVINANTAGAIVRKAHEKKVKVIAYDRMSSEKAQLRFLNNANTIVKL